MKLLKIVPTILLAAVLGYGLYSYFHGMGSQRLIHGTNLFFTPEVMKPTVEETRVYVKKLVEDAGFKFDDGNFSGGTMNSVYVYHRIEDAQATEIKKESKVKEIYKSDDCDQGPCSSIQFSHGIQPNEALEILNKYNLSDNEIITRSLDKDVVLLYYIPTNPLNEKSVGEYFLKKYPTKIKSYDNGPNVSPL